MRFSPQFLDQLRSRIALSQVVGERILLRPKGNKFEACCPFHKEKTASFFVDDNKGYYHCFGCSVHGDIISFIMEMDKLSFPETVSYLADLAGIPLPAPTTQTKSQDHQPKDNLYNVLEKAATWFQNQLQKAEAQYAQNYLKSRGFTAEIIQKFKLGFAPPGSALRQFADKDPALKPLLLEAGLCGRDDKTSRLYDRFRDRVIFPIHDKKGRVVGFGGRTLGDSQPKYLNSPETPVFSKKHLLYGQPFIDPKARDQPLVVVEGYTDVISLHQNGFRRAVAPLGTALTTDQILESWKITPQPLLCFDGDEAGRRAANRAALLVLPLLREGFSLGFVFLPRGEDPDSLIKNNGAHYFQTLLDQARPLGDVLWEYEALPHPRKTPEQKALLQKNILDKLKLIQNANVRSLYERDFKNRLYNLFRQARFKSTAAQPLRPSGVKTLINRTQLQCKILLKVLMMYPALIPQTAEDLIQIDFENQELERVRESMILAFETFENLDKTALRTHLSHVIEKHILESFDDLSLKAHVAFAQPPKPIEDILKNWQAIWAHVMQEQHLSKDMDKAHAKLKENMTDAQWKTYQEMKNQAFYFGDKDL